MALHWGTFGLYYFLVFGCFVAFSQWLVPYFVNVYYQADQDREVVLKVMDLTGKVVYSQELGNVNKGSKSLKIDTNNFMNGTYILSIVGTHHKGASKIIVQK